MTPEQITLVQESFSKVVPIADQVAALFYKRLFEIAPQTQPLFKGDMADQGKKLMATLGVVVRGLSNLESILPAASALAKRHVEFGVKAEHYAPVGEALLWTLEQGLGAAWNRKLKESWAEAYGTLSGFMIAEAYGQTKAA